MLFDCNCFIVTVPTPINKSKLPNLEPLKNATTMIGNFLKKGDIVIYESTVYPGCTEEFCVPILEKESQLKFNEDFFCGYSPERINPVDKTHKISAIKKVTREVMKILPILLMIYINLLSQQELIKLKYSNSRSSQNY